MMRETYGNRRMTVGSEGLQDRKVYERFRTYLKKTAALDESSSDRMDQTKILLRLTMWKAEHRDEELCSEELWEDISEGYGQERMGELLTGMNGTLISYSPDREDAIQVTDLGMKIVTDTIRDLHHNCPL